MSATDDKVDLDTPIPLCAFIVSARTEDATEVGHRSFAWRIESRSTSFYIKVMHERMNDFKISLHGPDERSGIGPPILKIGRDTSSKAEPPPESRMLGDGVRLPLEFPGQKVTEHVRRILRFSFASELFSDGLPLGYNVDLSKSVSKKGRHSKWTMPEDGGLHVDVYLAEKGADPYWPNRKAIEEKKAGIGPLVNSAGQSLTIVGKRVRDPHRGDPNFQSVDQDEIDQMGDGIVRWLCMKPDPKGVLWITEKLGPAIL
ncbi:hypothetical protein L5G28_16355 [Gordonia sp. HY285]|uniref:hypothetical protein n=1 Tax=Gordonia liuliyuniae TaxID=2911517 RepID=UPI001F301320|nr:hypothetical protein [Gordonia liuliyuniae]MCF8611719.1 hypothetical protein [Gordonia liuliyuniae]